MGRRISVPMTNGSRNERWLAAKITGPSWGMCSRPTRLRRKYKWKNGCRTPRAIQYTNGFAPCSRARACSLSACIVRDNPGLCGSSQLPLVALDRTRTARGALAGAVAAGVWAAQQPLDKMVFGSCYDDVELLGKAVTRGPAWPAVGAALHVANGALFGAVYANAAPRMPLPSWARGPAAALAEHFTTWPLTGLTDSLHPARDDLPKLLPSPRAFAQATWRHLLFGVVLGELERRLNAPDAPEMPDYETVVSSNGHGRFEAAVSAP